MERLLGGASTTLGLEHASGKLYPVMAAPVTAVDMATVAPTLGTAVVVVVLVRHAGGGVPVLVMRGQRAIVLAHAVIQPILKSLPTHIPIFFLVIQIVVGIRRVVTIGGLEGASRVVIHKTPSRIGGYLLVLLVRVLEINVLYVFIIYRGWFVVCL